MILALFGTNPYPFERLVEFLETLAREEGHEIVVQHGSSRAPDGCQSFDYASYQGILDLMARADVVVAQGGYGSSLDALTLGRPLVLVPRLRDLAESLDDQIELVRHLTASGRALSAQSYPEFALAISQALSTNGGESVDQEQLFGQSVARVILDHLEKVGGYQNEQCHPRLTCYLGYLGGGVDSVLDSYLQADEILPESVRSHVVIVRPPGLGPQKVPEAGTSFSIVEQGTLQLFRAAQETARHIKENGSDIVFLHGFNATILGYLLRWLLPANLPIVSTYHGTYFPRTVGEHLKAAVFDRLERRFFKCHANAVIAVSHHSVDILKGKGVPPEKLRALHNAIAFSDSPTKIKKPTRANGQEDSVKLITVSRLAAQKGIDVLLYAFAKVAQKYQKAELLIAGSGPLEHELKSLVQNLGILSNVVFLGNRSDIAEILPTADIFVMTSRQEDHSISILEAMRAGLPILVTDVGGNSESVRHGREGFLVADLDTVAAEHGMSQLIDSPDLRARFGQSARVRFEANFQSSIMIEKLFGIISEFVRKE